jgi:ABC-type branched-subunit amino acid transport system substrate-binding protein
VSCDLTEGELPEIGLGVADGQLAAASYFDSLDSAANRALKAQVAARFGSERRVSSYFATSYATVRLCVEALTRCGTDDPIEVRSALADLQTPSPLGPLRIDPATNHANLPFLLGRISGADFAILQSRPAAVADPYLIRKRTIAQPRSPQPQLRVVS